MCFKFTAHLKLDKSYFKAQKPPIATTVDKAGLRVFGFLFGKCGCWYFQVSFLGLVKVPIKVSSIFCLANIVLGSKCGKEWEPHYVDFHLIPGSSPQLCPQLWPVTPVTDSVLHPPPTSFWRVKGWGEGQSSGYAGQAETLGIYQLFMAFFSILFIFLHSYFHKCMNAMHS